MGAVQIDIYKKDRMYYNITLSNVDIIEGLMRYRRKLDKYYGIKQNYNWFQAGDINGDVVSELIALYVDLDDIINSIQLSEVENKVIQCLFDEMTNEEIQEIIGENYNANRIVNSIFRKIKEENDERWFSWVWLNKKKVPWNYKKCSKCGQMKPATEKYFRKHPYTKDKLQSQCRKCET